MYFFITARTPSPWNMFSVFLLRYVVMSIFKAMLGSGNMFLMTPDLQSIPTSPLSAPGLLHGLIHPHLLSEKDLINSVMQRNR